MTSRSLRCGLALVILLLARQLQAQNAPLTVTRTANAQEIPAFDIFELTFQHEVAYANPFWDVTIDVTFTSPGAKTVKIGGFHYGSLEKPKIRVVEPAGAQGKRQTVYEFDKSNIWKARFAPNEVGPWAYSYVFRNSRGGEATGSGQFACVKGDRPNPGFLRQDPANPFNWVFDNGTPFFAMGIQECLGDSRGLGTCLAALAMEGPFRTDRKGFPPLPPGPLFKAGPSMNPVNGDVYFRHYSQCGFNLFRFSQANCSWPLNDNFDRYRVQEAIMTDELLAFVRKYDMRVMYGVFGFQPVFNDHPDDAAGMEKAKRFIKYSVDRWGAYVDIWELLNEQKADARWYAITAPYLKQIDPYHHPVATSWERPELDGIDVCAPHWYATINDMSVVTNAAKWKKSNKPVIVGEHGNLEQRKPTSRPVEIGGVWDPTSAQRMRVRNWLALFNQISYVFWNTSYAKDGHNMNIWLGPREREYIRAMQDFAYCLGPGLKMAPVAATRPGEIKAFGVASDRRAGIYVYKARDATAVVKGISVTMDIPLAAKGYWYDTKTAAILQTIDVPAGRQVFAVPDFLVDIALLITPDGPPDIDKDGKPNDVDEDNDNDGVPNAKDAFPLEPEEWADTDGDDIGDNMDADKNGDGVADDDNHNGVPDYQEMDFDGDGVPRANAVPWDAYPLDPKRH